MDRARDVAGDPEGLAEQGIEAAGAGRADEAVAVFERLVAAHPDSARYRDLLGSALQLAGKLERAIACHERAIELGQDADALMRYNLAVAHGSRGDPDDAEQSYRRAIELDDAMAMAHANLGALLQHRGDLLAADACYEAALAAEPGNAWARANHASLLCALGRFEAAEAAYREAIVAAPGLAHAHSGLGAVLALGGATDATDEAVACYGRALELDPGLAEAHQHLARLLVKRGELDAALEASARSCSYAPSDAVMRNTHGVVLELLGRYAEAQQEFRRAIDADPAWGVVHYNLGVALEKNNQTDEAVAAYQASLALDPESHLAQSNLASALRNAGKLEASRHAFRRALELDPDDVVSRHLLDAVSGEVTGCAPAEYVRTLFDHYAPRYDAHMVQGLRYQGPAHIVRALVEDGLSVSSGAALDLGCGTGLVGIELRSLVGALHGVDLAPRMLDVARARGVYDLLVAADMVDMLSDSSVGAARYDAMTAADVLIYVGDLEALMHAARARLTPGGRFAFTVEAFEGAGFTLRDTGRYAHSRAYIEDLARAAGFEHLACNEVAVRMQAHAPVPALAFVVR